MSFVDLPAATALPIDRDCSPSQRRRFAVIVHRRLDALLILTPVRMQVSLTNR
jgi:hypothetical protein